MYQTGVKWMKMQKAKISKAHMPASSIHTHIDFATALNKI